MAVNSKNVASQSLFVNSSLMNTHSGGEEKVNTSTMLVLMNALAECKNKNVKKAIVEFNESYNATYGNDDLFTSKLLELGFGDLELLYQTLCAGEKSRRSSKQHEKKSGSFKKKTSVGDSSFANAAFEGELRTSSSSSSLGRKRSQVSLSEDSLQGKACLRKAFLLVRDMLKAECPSTQNEAFLSIVNIHLKVENYYSCTVLCVEYKEKFTVERFLCSLDDVQVLKISDICLFIASKESTGTDLESRMEYSKLALKLQPNAKQPIVSLCNLYRMNNETEKAFSTVKIFLEEVNPKEESVLVLQIICLTDNSKYTLAKSHLEETLQNHPEFTQLQMVLGFLYILSKETARGITLIESLKVLDDMEKKKVFASILELLKAFNVQLLVTELYQHLLHLNTSDTPPKDIVGKKALLSLASRLLVYKSPNNLETAKLYVDCLYYCGEVDIAQDFLIKLVKENPKETLPMVYLANNRLKLGAYVASTEDFRVLLAMYGESNLANDLSKLPMEDRKEIARVHRLHGVRYLGHELAFGEAAECFTIVLCAIGPAATGLLLSRGYCYMHLNDFKSAEKDFKDCLQRNELLTAALCARAVLYAVTTHVVEALRDFKEAFSIDPIACQKCLPKLPFEHVTVFSQLVIQCIKQGVENAGASKKKLYDISEIGAMDTISTHNELEKDILGYSEFLCKVFPTNVDYISTYIECLHLRHDKATMKVAIDRALAAFPGEARFLIWKGVVLAEQRKLDEAITNVKDISNSSADNVYILSYLSPKARKQLFERSMKKGKKSAEKCKYGNAVTYFTLASTLFTNNVASLRERLECYNQIGDQKRWMLDLGRILMLEPTANDFCVRASHYQKQGEDLNACEDYIHALETNESETIQIVTMNSNTEDVTKLFHITALSMNDLNKTRIVVRLCETGLKFDPNHKGLKHLMEKSSLNRCCIQ